MSLRFVAGREFVEQFRVHFHKRLEHIIHKSNYGLVPMFLRDAVERGEHYRHYYVVVLFHQRHDILVIPEVQSPLRNLWVNKKKLIANKTMENILD